MYCVLCLSFRGLLLISLSPNILSVVKFDQNLIPINALRLKTSKKVTSHGDGIVAHVFFAGAGEPPSSSAAVVPCLSTLNSPCHMK